MWTTGAGIVQVASILTALSALVLAVFTLKRASGPPDLREFREAVAELRSAFKQLEADSEKMWEMVQSHLRRISRLKKDMKPSADDILQRVNQSRAEQTQQTAVAPAPTDPELLYLEWKERNGR